MELLLLDSLLLLLRRLPLLHGRQHISLSDPATLAGAENRVDIYVILLCEMSDSWNRKSFLVCYIVRAKKLLTWACLLGVVSDGLFQIFHTFDDGLDLFGRCLGGGSVVANFDLQERVPDEADVVDLKLDRLNDAVAGGGDLGDQFVGEDFDKVVKFLNLRARLHVPLLNRRFLRALAQVRQRHLNDLVTRAEVAD